MKLVDYFERNQESLRSQLEGAKTPDDVVNILTGEIRRLSGEYIKKLIPSQMNVALALLYMFERSVKLSTETGFKEYYSQYSQYIDTINNILKKSTPQEVAKKIDDADIYPIAGAILFGSAGAWFGPMGSFLGGSAGAFLGKKIKSELVNGEKGKNIDSRTGSAPELKLEINTDLLISKFEAELKTIDELVIKYGKPPEPPEPKLEDHPAALEFFQNCLKQKQEGKIPPELMKKLLYLLKASKIEIQNYKPDSSDNRYEKFEFVPYLGSEDYETIKPALVQGDRVILKGEVRAPMSDT